MPARIYALAKELNIDSKDLVDLVKKVGITGKGSALASLTDEEAQKVREHLSAAERPAQPVVSAVAAQGAVRDAVPLERKPIAIKVGRSSGQRMSQRDSARPSSPAPSQPASTSEVGADKEVVQPSAQASAAPPSSTPAATPPSGEQSSAGESAAAGGSMVSRIKSRMADRKSPASSSDSIAPLRRDNAIASAGKMRSLDRRPVAVAKRNRAMLARANAENHASTSRWRRCQMWSSRRPSKPAAGEPKAQKPDVKLSPDVIAGHRQGMRAPLEQLVKEDTEKKRAGAAAKRGGLSGFTGEKARKGEKEFEDDRPRKKLAGMASPRAERTRGKGRAKISLDQSGGPGGSMPRMPRGSSKKRRGVNTAAPRKEAVMLELPCTVRSFSEAAGVSVGKVLGTLMAMGVQFNLNINSQLDLEAAEMIASRTRSVHSAQGR